MHDSQGHDITKANDRKSFDKSTVLFFIQIMVVMVGLGFARFTFAADVKLTPGIAVGGAYDDNIFFTSENKIDSSIFTVSPSFDLDFETLITSISLEADWDILRYLDESDLDRTNQYYRLNGDHRLEERWDTSFDLDFYRDTTLNTYLQETGRAIKRVERDFFEVGGNVAYDITLVSGISTGYHYQNVSYDDEFTDYYNHSANLYYFHRLKSEVDKLSFGPSYYHRNNDLNEVDSYTFDIAWDRDWSSITRSDISVGARYTNITDVDGTEDDSWGAKANLDFDFEGVVTSTTIRYFHDLRTTVDGDDLNVDNFYLDYRRSLTERFGIGFNGRLVFSYQLSDQQSDIDDERYYWLEPRLYYQLTQNFDLSLRYRYQNNVEYRDEGDVTRERNIIWLQLGYDLPFLL